MFSLIRTEHQFTIEHSSSSALE